jgi:GTP-binding protein
MFIDQVQILIKAGSGGDGRLNFRHEKFVDRGGPDGGDGGNGGSVIFLASRNENTLAAFRFQPRLLADEGKPGEDRRKHGRSGDDLIVKVPIGTVVSDENGKVIADLAKDEESAIIAAGGRGGFGNAHFVSSTRQAPAFSEKGEKTEMISLNLEMKMIADVGLVGLPNAGKSTLLATFSNAKPAIADYPFTTLVPNLGVVDVDPQTTLLLADIPGLIEGASEGKGLGDQFLRHIERTLVIVHLIDVYNPDVKEAYSTIQNELSVYKIDLSKKPQLVVLTKIEGLDKKDLDEKIAELSEVVPKKTKIIAMSSLSREGAKEFLDILKDIVIKQRAKQEKVDAKKAKEIPVIRLTTDNKWTIKKVKKEYLVTGHKIEKFAGRTDFDNNQSIARIRNIMQKMGIMHELNRMGVKPGDTIKLGSYGSIDY